jgi:anti-sigma28 factor (negative regulator of flagellin synthesis)
MANDQTSPSGVTGTAAAAVRKQEVLPTDKTQEVNSSEERIAELRRRYLEGSYTVDADELSAKIVDAHLES